MSEYIARRGGSFIVSGLFAKLRSLEKGVERNLLSAELAVLMAELFRLDAKFLPPYSPAGPKE